ncbi:putative RNA-directed DNA polymerase from transposon BS [Trichonephila clavipes]|nr:putative RNA-directed DNA polymerase from transposon BS [Trichonephila clavipes]
MPVLQPLIAERRQILKDLDSDRSDTNRIKLNRVNAQLKKKYAQIKRDRWDENCSSLDSKSSNSKLWQLVKGIGKEQPQFEKCNTIQSTDGLLAQNDDQAANILGEHYQLTTSLDFTGNDKYASNVDHICRSNPHVDLAIFSRAFSAQEFDAAILEIEKVINNDCEIRVFADDIVLWSSGSDTEKVEESVNLALADVWSFAVNHKLSISPSKSVVGFFTTSRKLFNFRPRILLNSQLPEIEKYPRYLGFILDPEILSNRHLEHLALRARKRIKILKYISGRDWGADAGTFRNTFPSFVPFWNMASPSSVAPLIQTCKNLNVFNSVLQGLLQAFSILAQKILYSLKLTCSH